MKAKHILPLVLLCALILGAMMALPSVAMAGWYVQKLAELEAAPG